MTVNKAKQGITTGSTKNAKKDPMAARAVMKPNMAGAKPAPKAEKEKVSDTEHVWKGGVDHFGEAT